MKNILSIKKYVRQNLYTKKIKNYFNKIHKKRISQRSKIFDLRIIFTKMTANSLCIKSMVILQLTLFCMLLIETNDYLIKLSKFIMSLNGIWNLLEIVQCIHNTATRLFEPATCMSSFRILISLEQVLSKLEMPNQVGNIAK